MKVAIVGTGLIGGSIALSLRKEGFADYFIGVEKNVESAAKAVERHIVDEILPLHEAVDKADLIILSIPVDGVEKMISDILDRVEKQVVFDVGSTKESLCCLVKDHPKRGRFVATHPMWGTEYSGPMAAVDNGFAEKTTVICEREKSDEDALHLTERVYDLLKMKIVYMKAGAHDIHAAYVSHISHITSFALANTVLEKEKEEDAIFDMASGGFESTVRLAKSSPDMWLPIFMQNRENVLDVLNEHISQLKKFRSCFEKDNYEYMRTLMENANKIKKIIH